MRWRDIRFEKPTEKDATACGRILQRLFSGAVGIYSWHHHADMVAWMPLSELPQPDLPGPIPDGWRPVDQAVDKKRTDEMFWLNGAWRATSRNDTWDSEAYYIAPIDPPAPQYRPFATWQEWWPHRDRWVRWGFDIVKFCWRGSVVASEHFDRGVVFLNDDGTDAEPFGVLITEAKQ